MSHYAEFIEYEFLPPNQEGFIHRKYSLDMRTNEYMFYDAFRVNQSKWLYDEITYDEYNDFTKGMSVKAISQNVCYHTDKVIEDFHHIVFENGLQVYEFIQKPCNEVLIELSKVLGRNINIVNWHRDLLEEVWEEIYLVDDDDDEFGEE